MSNTESPYRIQRLENFYDHNKKIVNYLQKRKAAGFLNELSYVKLLNHVVALVVPDYILDSDKFFRIEKRSHQPNFSEKISDFFEKKSLKNFTALRITNLTQKLRLSYGQSLESYKCKQEILRNWFLIALIYFQDKK